MIIDLPTKPKIYVGYGTRNSSGVESVTGVGFKPVGLCIIGHNNDYTMEHGIGFCDSINSVEKHIYVAGTKTNITSGKVLWIYEDVLIQMYAVCTSFDDDGFTLTWTRIGGIDINYGYLCIG